MHQWTGLTSCGIYLLQIRHQAIIWSKADLMPISKKLRGMYNSDLDNPH